MTAALLTGCAAVLLLGATRWMEAARRRALLPDGGGMGRRVASSPLPLAALRRFLGSGARERDALDLWPGAVHRMVALLQAGADPLVVWRALGSWAEEARAGGSRETWSAAPGRDLRKALEHAGAAAGTGGDPFAALRAVPLEDPRSREARDILTAAWRVSGATGAPLVGVLTRVAGGLEDALDAADAREAAIAASRSTGRLLAALPFLGLGLGMLMGTDPLGTLLGTGWGRVVLAVGSALSVAGVVWSRRLIRIAEGGEA